MAQVRKRAQGSRIGAFLGWRYLLPLNCCLLVLVAWRFAQEWSNDAEVRTRLQNLKGEVARLTVQNTEYESAIRSIGTSATIEREARTKLNYQKPGEQTLVLRDGEAGAVVSYSNAALEAGVPTGNPEKWWRYFFGAR